MRFEFSKMMVAIGVTLLVAGVVFNFLSEQKRGAAIKKQKTSDEEYMAEKRFNRNDYLEKAKWGTLEKELERIGVSDFRYYVPEDPEESKKIITNSPHPKSLIGSISDKVKFRIEEAEDVKAENDLVFIIDGVEIQAIDPECQQVIKADDTLYVSCDGMIIITKEQMDCIKYLKDGGEISKPRRTYEGMTVEDWL